MNARITLLGLYGDYLHAYGAKARVAALIRMLAALGVTAPTARAAVSRLAKQGWLEPVPIDGAAGYTVTERAARWLRVAMERLSSPPADEPWDGSWQVVVPREQPKRSGRERLRRALAFCGYAPLGNGTWIAARASTEIVAMLHAEDLLVDHYPARHSGDDVALVRQAWDLDAVARSYTRWLASTRDQVTSHAGRGDEAAFVAHSRLLGQWREFLFTDPRLPAQLLPARWPGHEAAELFAEQAAALAPAAQRFVAHCLTYARSDER